MKEKIVISIKNNYKYYIISEILLHWKEKYLRIWN